MIEHALKKLRIRDDLSPREEDILRGSVVKVVDIRKKQTFVKADTPLSSSNILVEGLVCRYRDLSNGERQVTEMHVPGDFVDLHSFLLKRLDHSIEALTPSRIAVVPHRSLQIITETEPHLARMLWLSTVMDAAIHREWTVSLGRRPATARIAHLFCEFYERLKAIGLASNLRYTLPITQTDLGECLGLTPIHVNRTLRALRIQRLVTFRSKLVVIDNVTALQELAEFDPNYLFLDKQPR